MSRELKRNKTKFEKLIRKVWQETKKGTVISDDQQRCVVAAIKKTLDYLETNDYVHNKNNKIIFKKLYLSTLACMSQKEIANKFYFDKNTVGNYSDLYIKAFEKHFQDIMAGAKS